MSKIIKLPNPVPLRNLYSRIQFPTSMKFGDKGFIKLTNKRMMDYFSGNYKVIGSIYSDSQRSEGLYTEYTGSESDRSYGVVRIDRSGKKEFLAKGISKYVADKISEEYEYYYPKDTVKVGKIRGWRD